MHEQSKSAAIPEMPGFKECNAFLRSALQQNGTWTSEQARVLVAFQAASERWVEHRRHDFETSVAAMQQLASCKDLGDAAAIQQRKGCRSHEDVHDRSLRRPGNDGWSDRSIRTSRETIDEAINLIRQSRFGQRFAHFEVMGESGLRSISFPPKAG